MKVAENLEAAFAEWEKSEDAKIFNSENIKKIDNESRFKRTAIINARGWLIKHRYIELVDRDKWTNDTIFCRIISPEMAEAKLPPLTDADVEMIREDYKTMRYGLSSKTMQKGAKDVNLGDGLSEYSDETSPGALLREETPSHEETTLEEKKERLSIDFLARVCAKLALLATNSEDLDKKQIRQNITAYAGVLQEEDKYKEQVTMIYLFDVYYRNDAKDAPAYLQSMLNIANYDEKTYRSYRDSKKIPEEYRGKTLEEMEAYLRKRDREIISDIIESRKEERLEECRMQKSTPSLSNETQELLQLFDKGWISNNNGRISNIYCTDLGERIDKCLQAGGKKEEIIALINKANSESRMCKGKVTFYAVGKFTDALNELAKRGEES